MSKVVPCDTRNTFASFSEDDFNDDFHISWQVQRFGDLHRLFAWHAQHFRRVLLRILQIALSGLRQVVATCKSRGRRRTS